MSLGENRPAGRHSHALAVDENDAFVAFSTTFRGIIDAVVPESPNTFFNTDIGSGESTSYWHYTQGANNAAARSGGVDGTPAPYIQLLVCQKN